MHTPTLLTHPLDDGSAALLYRDLEATVAGFDNERDADIYRDWVGPMVADGALIVRSLIGPPKPMRVARHPFALARFGMPALLPASTLARRFRSPAARALVGIPWTDTSTLADQVKESGSLPVAWASS